MATVYLDTSFISACVSERDDPASIHRRSVSREWWVTQAYRHDCFISVEVLAELGAHAFRHHREALAQVRDLPLLGVSEEVRAFAAILVREKVMPGPVAGDAVHVALAAVNKIDYVLSWNVRHLANPSKAKHLKIICIRAGHFAPQIVTPESLWETS